jgi:hypothetical protein
MTSPALPQSAFEDDPNITTGIQEMDRTQCDLTTSESLAHSRAHRHVETMPAPVSLLPNEILSAIFEAGYCQPSCNWGPPFEISVSQVTAHWREVALSTPQLWTRIHFLMDQDHIEETKTYLQRSKALPLDLHLKMKRLEDDDGIFTCCSLINEHVGRWLRIKVYSDWRRDLDCFLMHLPISAPILRHIQIQLKYDYQRTETEKIQPIFFAGAPSLTTILLSGVALRSCLPTMAAVTSLHLHKTVGSLSLRNFCAALNSLPALTHLVIQCDLNGVWSTVGTIEIPLLHSLQIRPDLNAEQIPGLLYIISAPLLHSLLLDTLVAGEVDFLDKNWDMTTAPPKYPSLRSLTVMVMCGSRFPHPLLTWRMLMRIFPTVEHFVLAAHEVDGFLQSLNEQMYPPYPASSLHWPDLRTLTPVHRPSYDRPHRVAYRSIGSNQRGASVTEIAAFEINLS